MTEEQAEARQAWRRTPEGRAAIKRHNAAAEHRVPIARGGRTEASNLVAACLACNLEKSTRTDDEFLGRAA